MTALIVLGCILLFFVFLLSLKATITIAYSDEVMLSVRVLFLKIKILPKKEKKGPRSMSRAKADKLRRKAEKKAAKKRDAAKAKAEKKQQKKAEKEEKPKKSISEILDIISLVRSIAAEVIRRFFKHLRIEVAHLRVKVATGDAATTAVAYGAVCAALNLLLPVLYDVKNFSLPKEKDFAVETDFVGDTPEIDIKLSFSLRVWHLFHVAFGALGKFLKHKIKHPSQPDHKYSNHK